MSVARAAWLVLATLVPACASEMHPGAAQTEPNAWIVADAGTTADVQSATTFSDAAKAADDMQGDGAGAVPSDAGVIHLKPGGAQNTAAFHVAIAKGDVPQPGDLDVQGWLNEHGTHLPPPAADQPIDLHALAALHTTAKGAPADIVIQLGFNTAQTLAELQPPLAVVVALDHSGSMAGPGLDQVRKATLRVFDSLPAGSQFGLVAFADDACACWPLATALTSQRTDLEQKLQGLEAKGGTNLHQGLTEALQQLDTAPVGATRIVLLVTDGGPTVGPGASAILSLAQAHAGVHVGAVAVGPDADVALLGKLAEVTQGSWLAASDPADIEATVLGRLQSLLLPLATDLSIQVVVPAGWQVQTLFGLASKPTESGVIVGGPDAQTPTSGNADADKLAVLYAAQDDGIVLARLLAPDQPDLAKLQNVQVATVQWSYRLSKEGPTGPLHKGERKVVAPGLVDIPDAGLAYYESPIVRRAYALLQVGEQARQVLTLWQDGKRGEARGKLADLLVYVAAEEAALGAEDYDHALQDALDELQKLGDILDAHLP